MDQIVEWLGERYGLLGLVLGALASAATTLTYWSYRAALSTPGPQREELKASLRRGGDPRKIYVAWVRGLLDWLDGLLGDGASKRDGAPAADWTSKLFDFCALFAVLYPVLSIVLTWIFAGDVGPIGGALGLEPNAPLLARASLLVAITFFLAAALVLASARAARRGPHGDESSRDRSILISVLYATGLVLTLAAAATGAGVGAIAILAAFTFAVLGPQGYSGAVSLAFALIFSIAAGLSAYFGASVFAFALPLFALSVVLAGALTSKGWLAFYWMLAFPIALVVSAFAPYALAPFASPNYLAILPFIGIIAFVNIPFDWFSIGLTRWLLRLGLRPGWQPYLIVLIDLISAVIVLFTLGAATILAIEVVNVGTVLAGKSAPIPLDEIFHDLRTQPTSSEHAWIYFTLFSTLVPSIVNLVIASASLIAWPLPGGWLARQVERYEQDGRGGLLVWLPALLTGVWVVGFGLVGALIWLGGPWLLQLGGLGHYLIDAAEWFAHVSLPWVEAMGRVTAAAWTQISELGARSAR